MSASAPANRTILLVDDEPDVLRSVADLLEASLSGVHVLQATSGQHGLELLGGQHVDVIIADFRMSGMDGIEFLYIAQQKRPGVPSMMLTAFAHDAGLRRNATALGVQAVVSKAVGPQEFVEQVGNLLSARGPAVVRNDKP